MSLIGIDAWIQDLAARHLAEPIFDSLRRWTKSDKAATPSVADTVAVLDEAGVSQALTSAWYAPRNAMISNDEVAAFVEESDDLLVGVGSVHITQPMEAIREIRRCINELRSKAIGLLPWLWSVPPTDRLFYPVFAACCELGVPCRTQIGYTGPLMPSEFGRPIYLDQVVLDFPDLAIVGGQIG